MRLANRAVSVVVAIVLAASALGACSKDKSDARKANDSLTHGLEAQSAGKTGDAVKAYRETLVLDPRNKYAAYNLGLISQLAGKAAEAERHYRLTLSIDPDFVPALFNLAILRTEADPKEAEELYRRAIEVAPDDPGPHLNLGYLLNAQGRTAEGQAELDTATKLDPRYSQPQSPQPTTTTTSK
jgi:tetratricopeptide (TPR) repeat protein